MTPSAARLNDPDLLVIGGGAGGLSAARAGARRGASVVLVDAGRLGGECTFTGCVPSKTLIECAAAGASFAEAMARVHTVVEAIASTEDDTALGHDGVTVMHGWARFTAPGVVDLDGATLRPRRTIIATGSRPVVPAIPGLDGAGALTNETIFDLDRQPGHLAILGGGAIGCELAQAFQRLGTAVTLLEAAPRILPAVDPDASAVIATVLRREGVDVRAGARLDAADGSAGGWRLSIGDATLAVDALLVAAGRVPSIDGLGLDAAGVEVDDGAIVTGDTLATTARSVWAVGDVTGRMLLTHAADEMGRLAVANAFGRRRRRFDPGLVPSVVFTHPEVAHVGVAEADLAGQPHHRAFLPMARVDRAVTAGATDGFVKLLARPRPLLRNVGGGRLVGATIVAERAGELIAVPALAMRTGMFVGRLAQTVQAYPTWSVSLRQAAAQFFLDEG